MSVTETTICNGALGFLSDGPITSLQDASEQARLCNEHYPVARRLALQLHDWKFATRRALLNRLSVAPAFGYLYQYALPTGYLSTYETHPVDLVYVMESNPDTGAEVMLTDYETPGLVYSCDIEDSNRFSPLFVATLELVLAVRLCMVITEKRDLKLSLNQELTEMLMQAKKRDAKQNPARQTIPVEMDLVRRSVAALWE